MYTILSTSAGLAYGLVALDVWEPGIGCLGWTDGREGEAAGVLVSMAYVVYAVLMSFFHIFAIAMACFHSNMGEVEPSLRPPRGRLIPRRRARRLED